MWALQKSKANQKKIKNSKFLCLLDKVSIYVNLMLLRKKECSSCDAHPANCSERANALGPIAIVSTYRPTKSALTLRGLPSTGKFLELRDIENFHSKF